MCRGLDAEWAHSLRTGSETKEKRDEEKKTEATKQTKRIKKTDIDIRKNIAMQKLKDQNPHQKKATSGGS